MHETSCALQMLVMIVWKVVYKNMSMKLHKLQLLNILSDDDKRKHFILFPNIKKGRWWLGFMNCLYFTDKETFHMNEIVNRHNCQIWGTQKPHKKLSWFIKSEYFLHIIILKNFTDLSSLPKILLLDICVWTCCSND